MRASSMAIFGGFVVACGAPDISQTKWRCTSSSDCGEGFTCNVTDNVCEPASDGIDGVYSERLVVGMSGPFSGSAIQMGLAVRAGIEAYFAQVNRLGGVGRRRLELKTMDDGYDPTLALNNVQAMIGNREVFAVMASIGTPTAEVTAPYAVEQRTLFFGAVTGATILRRDPPERYVFNYRASYRQETEKMVGYLTSVRQPSIPVSNIAVFAQGLDEAGTLDGYGRAGYEGVLAAVRSRRPGGTETSSITYATYPRNSSAIGGGVAAMLRWLGSGGLRKDAQGNIRAAIVLVGTPTPASIFVKDLVRKVVNIPPGEDREYDLSASETAEIAKVSDLTFGMLSFGGDVQFGEDLRGHGTYRDRAGSERRFCDGIVVTQVVPHFDSSATGVLQFRDHLAANAPGTRPSFLALEGYLVARLFVAGLERHGRGITAESFVETLESLDQVNIGIGTTLQLSQNRHQASDKVWGTRLNGDCGFDILDLEN